MNKIGIVAQDQPEEKFGVNKNYLEWIIQFGYPIVILPSKAQDFNEIYKIDALVLPGGADVDGKRYNSFSFYNGNPNNYLEYFDVNILPNLVGVIPIFGICRGLQTLNVLFGGTLRNIWGHPYSEDTEDLAHKIRLNPLSVGRPELIEVNSFHHQAIRQLAANFKVEAIHTSDNVVEAISDKEKKIFAVQYHPERMDDDFSTKKFKEILA